MRRRCELNELSQMSQMSEDVPERTWFMPALANSNVGSSSGMVDDEWT